MSFQAAGTKLIRRGKKPYRIVESDGRGKPRRYIANPKVKSVTEAMTKAQAQKGTQADKG